MEEKEEKKYTEDQIRAAAVVVGTSTDKRQIDDAFVVIAEAVDKIIVRLSHKFRLPNEDPADIKQLCLISLIDACKAYDPERPFPPFAATVMTRRLYTAIAASQQRRKQINNKALSLDAERRTEGSWQGEPSNIRAIIPAKTPIAYEDRVEMGDKINQLYRSLSDTEQMVLIALKENIGSSNLYVSIRDYIAEHYGRTLGQKQVDNALLRMRRKAEEQKIRNIMLSA